MTTKQQLRAERRHALNGWLALNALILDEYPFWTQATKDAEMAAFAELNATYETRKLALADELKTLDKTALTTFFENIGWSPVGETAEERIHDYLARF